MSTSSTTSKRSRKPKPPKEILTPLYDRVIVRRDKPNEKYGVGLIIIPESAQEKMQRGVVIAAGTGKISDLTNDVRPMQVKPGDRILFGKFTGDPIEIDGEEFIMMREDAIYCRLNKE